VYNYRSLSRNGVSAPSVQPIHSCCFHGSAQNFQPTVALMIQYFVRLSVVCNVMYCG